MSWFYSYQSDPCSAEAANNSPVFISPLLERGFAWLQINVSKQLSLETASCNCWKRIKVEFRLLFIHCHSFLCENDFSTRGKVLSDVNRVGGRKERGSNCQSHCKNSSQRSINLMECINVIAVGSTSVLVIGRWWFKPATILLCQLSFHSLGSWMCGAFKLDYVSWDVKVWCAVWTRQSALSRRAFVFSFVQKGFCVVLTSLDQSCTRPHDNDPYCEKCGTYFTNSRGKPVRIWTCIGPLPCPSCLYPSKCSKSIFLCMLKVQWVKFGLIYLFFIMVKA